MSPEYWALRALQLIAGLCWLIPFVTKVPSLYRVLSGQGACRNGDPIRVVVWFVAASQLGFIARWLIYGQTIRIMLGGELAVWAGMYFLSALCALSLFWVVRSTKRD